MHGQSIPSWSDVAKKKPIIFLLYFIYVSLPNYTTATVSLHTILVVNPALSPGRQQGKFDMARCVRTDYISSVEDRQYRAGRIPACTLVQQFPFAHPLPPASLVLLCLLTSLSLLPPGGDRRCPDKWNMPSPP